MIRTLSRREFCRLSSAAVAGLLAGDERVLGSSPSVPGRYLYQPARGRLPDPTPVLPSPRRPAVAATTFEGLIRAHNAAARCRPDGIANFAWTALPLEYPPARGARIALVRARCSRTRSLARAVRVFRTLGVRVDEIALAGGPEDAAGDLEACRTHRDVIWSGGYDAILAAEVRVPDFYPVVRVPGAVRLVGYPFREETLMRVVAGYAAAERECPST